MAGWTRERKKQQRRTDDCRCSCDYCYYKYYYYYDYYNCPNGDNHQSALTSGQQARLGAPGRGARLWVAGWPLGGGVGEEGEIGEAGQCERETKDQQ